MCMFILVIVRLIEHTVLMDAIDKQIVHILQTDASVSVRDIADTVGLTATPCWRRIQNLEEAGIITGRVALVDPREVNLSLTALVLIRTNEHNAEWSGELDYLLKVVVPDMDAYDQFYLRLIEFIDLYDVRSTFVMEEMKRTTALPLSYV